MNFNIILLLLVLSSCGVKSDPHIPSGTEIPSYIDPFVDEAFWKNKKDKK